MWEKMFIIQMESIMIFQWDVKFIRHIFMHELFTFRSSHLQTFQWFSTSRMFRSECTPTSNWALNRGEIKNLTRFHEPILVTHDVNGRNVVESQIESNQLYWNEYKQTKTLKISLNKKLHNFRFNFLKLHVLL